MKFLAVIAFVVVAQAAKLVQKSADPIPEKPNQYNRVCDEVAPGNTGCWAGNP